LRVSTAELLLHPVRLRIVQAFLGDRRLTTGQLRGELTVVPHATLYRHVGQLVEAGVLRVVAEERVRGAVERTYALDVGSAQISAGQLAGMSAEDHRRAFTAFVAGLLGDFDRYVTSGEIDLVRDGVGYRQRGLWLSDAELVDMLGDLQAVVAARADFGPQAGRVRRLFSTVLLPTGEAR
jgi:hypothetical protein